MRKENAAIYGSFLFLMLYETVDHFRFTIAGVYIGSSFLGLRAE
ncbi:hypothetical protein QW060_27785 [Myroides ceti]|uniref:Uncharacterized protein n=1 Tax=Paenimyroides ceti TaxID=395087 RepID=A0ABT8D198_9FLAO|nr:hypothetical protein [Paenimyroides ceti]MDN3710585.1 hypothetical protein [Paenimyroides ceti]